MKIIESTYDDYLFYEGFKNNNSFLAECIKNKSAKYFFIYLNNDIIGDFWFFINDKFPSSVDFGDLTDKLKDKMNNKECFDMILAQIKSEGYKDILLKSDSDDDLSYIGFKKILENKDKYIYKKII